MQSSAYGHDTFAQLYNRYRIYKVKWTAIFPSSTVDYQIAIGAVNHGAITASLDALLNNWNYY